MQQKKKLMTAGLTVATIAVTGHLMQSGGSVSALVLDPPDLHAANLVSIMPAKAIAAETPALDHAAPEPPVETMVLVAQDVALGMDVPAAVVVAPAEDDMPPAEPAPVADGLVEAAPETADTDSAPLDVASLDESAEGPGPLPAPVVMAPVLPEEAEAPAPLPVPRRDIDSSVAAVDEVPDAASEPRDLNEYGLACDVIMTASEKPSAMVRLRITAPCRAGERVTVRHEDLVYSATIDGLGTLVDDVPALVTDAAFSVTFPDGEVAETEVDVPLAAEIERVALQYNGNTGLQIHALEFGADYGESGHIWNGHPGSPDAALTLGGGYMTVLGDATLELPFMAEVYTLPADATTRDGVVRLSVEAEVTEDNCGRDVAGQTMQKRADGTMTPVSLTLSMPDCDAVGEFLVLKNLLRDLKIASN